MIPFKITCPYCSRRIPISSIRCPECRAIIPHECGDDERRRIFTAALIIGFVLALFVFAGIAYLVWRLVW